MFNTKNDRKIFDDLFFEYIKSRIPEDNERMEKFLNTEAAKKKKKKLL